MNRFIHFRTVTLCIACIAAGWLTLPACAGEPKPNQQHLQELNWIVGTWVHRGRTTGGEPLTITRKYQWVLDDNYITCFSAIRVSGDLARAHRHMIGWDSDKNIYRSWVFSSNGDFVRGVWHDVESDRRGGTLGGQTAGGEQISAKAVYTRDGEDTLRYEVTEYTIGGEPQPDMKLTFHRVRSTP